MLDGFILFSSLAIQSSLQDEYVFCCSGNRRAHPGTVYREVVHEHAPYGLLSTQPLRDDMVSRLSSLIPLCAIILVSLETIAAFL